MEKYATATALFRIAQQHHDAIHNEHNDELPLENEHLDSTQSSPPPRRLSLAFKSGTAASHQAAEDVHFVKNFIKGKIDRNLYGDLVSSLYHVYYAIEKELDKYASQHFATCHFPKELNRTPSLLEDLDFWHGTTDNVAMSRATQDYVDRIHYIAQKEPLLLLAHAYTRYLGDLSGGKILARVARKALDLDKSGEGLAFYHFENIQSAKLFKDEYRRALDTLPLTEDQISGLVLEANIAFLLNMRIFNELDVKANVPGAKVLGLQETIDFAISSSSRQAEEEKEEECPFLKMRKNEKKKGRCPWPFVFFHDPMTGMQDYQTWIVIAILMCWIWSKLQ